MITIEYDNKTHASSKLMISVYNFSELRPIHAYKTYTDL